jgi:Gpi18-like mannosyltransferase
MVHQPCSVADGERSVSSGGQPSAAYVARTAPRAEAEWFWVYMTVAGSLLLRLALLDFESGDYRAFLSGWYDFLLQHGRWHGLGQKFASYPPLYLYFLSLSTLLPLAKLYVIKSTTLVSDYVAAWFVWKLVRRWLPNGEAGWLWRRIPPEPAAGGASDRAAEKCASDET